jgi:mRNA interferase MazF
MKTGNIVLIRLPQVGGARYKLRPALVLSLLPGTYQNVLICGVSSKTEQMVANWDELLDSSQPDFSTSGLHFPSSIRLSYLYAADRSEISGTIGRISADRLSRLVNRLAARLRT